MNKDSEKTVYHIPYGGEKIKRYKENGLPIEYEIEENSKAPEFTGCDGGDTFGNMWHTSLEGLQEIVNEWAGEEVELQESTSEEYLYRKNQR